MFLQSIGIIPDNVIILEAPREKSESRINDKLKSNKGEVKHHETVAKESVDEMELNLKAVKNVFKGHCAELLTNNREKSQIIDEIAVNIKFTIAYC